MSPSKIDFAGYTFDRDKGCIACNHVIRGHPVLLFCHEEDGGLQFMCGAPGHESGDYTWVHTTHVLSKHPDLYALPTVNFGFLAERRDVDDGWKVAAIAD